MNSKFSTLVILVLLGFIVTATSCKKDDPSNCGSFGWAFAVSDELEAFSAAATAWSADPENKAKCEAYLEAYADYLDALRGYDNCVTGANRAEWQETIDQAIEEIDNTDCE